VLVLCNSVINVDEPVILPEADFIYKTVAPPFTDMDKVVPALYHVDIAVVMEVVPPTL
jgi:hypothetical protein